MTLSPHQTLAHSTLEFVAQNISKTNAIACDSCNLDYEMITGDASFRIYYRFEFKHLRYILMISPSDKIDNQPFIELNACFSESGLRVPKIIAANSAAGLILLEDLGETHLADLLHREQWLGYYQQVIDLLPKIAKVQPNQFMKPYDLSFIDQEMEIFNDWLVKAFCSLELDNAELRMWQQLKQQLSNSMLMQPQIVMHRDFHSRNIMQCDNQWVLIDYQDAVVGPLTYDLVSLLKDCYFVMPKDEQQRLLEYAFQVYQKVGLCDGLNFADFTLLFHLTGLQRHIKAAGIFCRLHLRDGKGGYLQNIPDTLAYIIDTAEKLKEDFSVFGYFSEFLKEKILPQIEAKL